MSPFMENQPLGKKDNTVRVLTVMNIGNFIKIFHGKPLKKKSKNNSAIGHKLMNDCFIFGPFLKQNTHNQNYNIQTNNLLTCLFSSDKLPVDLNHDKNL